MRKARWKHYAGAWAAAWAAGYMVALLPRICPGTASAALFLLPAWFTGALCRSRCTAAWMGCTAGVGTAVGACLACGLAWLPAAVLCTLGALIGAGLGRAGFGWQLGGHDWAALALCAEGVAVYLTGGPAMSALARLATAALLQGLLVSLPALTPVSAAWNSRKEAHT